MRPVGASGAATRGRIEAAATSLFAERGFAATGIRELARAAGVTSAALYNYMGTKEELLADLMRGVIEPLLAGARAIAATGATPAATLAGLVEQHVRLHGTHPLAARIADSELRALTGALRDDVVALRDAYEAVWVAVVERGVGEGAFAVHDPRLAAAALIGLASGVSGWYRPGGRLTLDEVAAAHAALCLGAVRGAAPARGAAPGPAQ